MFKKIIPHKKIFYELEDGREVEVVFSENGQGGLIEQEQKFDPENSHSGEMQKNG